LVEQVTDEKAWDEYVRTKARDSRGGMRSALTQILQLYRPMWQFATMIQEVEMGVEDVAEDVDVSPIWSMLFLNVKVVYCIEPNSQLMTVTANFSIVIG
jgi:hypothetical protein